MFLVAWFAKKIKNLYQRFIFEPHRAECFRFLEANGFLVIYLKPRLGLKLKCKAVVGSYFDSEDEEIALNVLDDLRRKNTKIDQRTFATTEEFVQFAKEHPVLKENSWVQADLDTPKIKESVRDFY